MATMEERLTALENEMAAIREQLQTQPARPGVIGRTRPDFLDTMVGIHADSPNAEEVFRQIAEEREREREEARRLAEEDQHNVAPAGH